MKATSWVIEGMSPLPQAAWPVSIDADLESGVSLEIGYF